MQFKFARYGPTSLATIALRWSGARCFLGNAPATISGGYLPFAMIHPDNPKFAPVEYSWHAVNRIMLLHGGRFEARGTCSGQGN